MHNNFTYVLWSFTWHDDKGQIPTQKKKNQSVLYASKFKLLSLLWQNWWPSAMTDDETGEKGFAHGQLFWRCTVDLGQVRVGDVPVIYKAGPQPLLHRVCVNLIVDLQVQTICAGEVRPLCWNRWLPFVGVPVGRQPIGYCVCWHQPLACASEEQHLSIDEILNWLSMIMPSAPFLYLWHDTWLWNQAKTL